jgi:hypothetical protein
MSGYPYRDARAAMALIRDAVEAARANSRTTCRVTGMCDPVHTPLPKASLRLLRVNLGRKRQHATAKAIHNGCGPEARPESQASRSG